MEVRDRVVLVTGGGSGIGAALCHQFALERAGAIYVCDQNRDAAREVAARTGGVAIHADVRRPEDINAMVAQVLDRHGRIDILCANAGVARGGGPEASDEDWQLGWDVHVMAHVQLARAVVPSMLARGEGYLLGTVSAAAMVNHVMAAPYAVSKAAELSLYEWLAIAHGDDGIRVSVLCPQGVRTPMLDLEERPFLAAGALEPSTVAEMVIEGLRAERFLILPHPEVLDYFQRKSADYDRWIKGMRRLRTSLRASAAD